VGALAGRSDDGRAQRTLARNAHATVRDRDDHG